MAELRAQLATILAGAINGDIDEKRGRLAINSATRIIEAFQAECRSRLIASQLKESVLPMGSQSL